MHTVQLHSSALTDKIRQAALRMAEAGAVLTIVQHAMAPARMAGSFEGIADASLQAFHLASDAGVANGLRVLGMLVVFMGVRFRSKWVSLSGATMACLSFAVMGHTVMHEPGWLLAPLLLLHVLVLAFWFGSLRPLRWIADSAGEAVAGQLEKFSRLAGIAVPVLFVAGIVLAALLLNSFAALTTPYGLMIIAKLSGFALLIGMASINRWRFSPRIRAGDAAAARSFRNLALGEWLLILLVIVVTEVMTSLVSP